MIDSLIKSLQVREIDSLPDSSGVYLFIDSNDLVLYVGKSIHLKRRVSQYFGKPGKSGQRQFVKSAESIGYIETPNEFLALLLEDVLIKKYWPPFNKRQKKTKLHTYLYFSKDDYPYLISSVKKPGKNYYGPFRDSFFADEMIGAINRNFRLRDCGKSMPAGECFRSGLGTCTAPCIGKIDRDKYQQKINEADIFLKNGTENSLFVEMMKKMDELSADFKFERAAQIRDDLDFLRRYSGIQKFLKPFCTETVVLTDGDPAEELYIFKKGKLVLCRPRLGSHKLTTAEFLEKVYQKDNSLRDPELEKLFPEKFEPVRDGDLFDRGLIISSWLKKDDENRQFLIL